MSKILLLVLLVTSLVTRAADKPNFIIIFTDDQGYGDLGCFGSTKIKTPNIDRLAKEGRKFTNFMVASPVCSPSRAALLTGCYPKRVSMHQHVLFPSSQKQSLSSTIILHSPFLGTLKASWYRIIPL